MIVLCNSLYTELLGNSFLKEKASGKKMCCPKLKELFICVIFSGISQPILLAVMQKFKDTRMRRDQGFVEKEGWM